MIAEQPWWLYLAVAGGSWALTMVLVPLFRRLAVTLDVVDRPGIARKVHTRVIPYLGGLPFYIVFLAVVLFIQGGFPQYARSVLYPMCAVGTLIVLMGVYDDIKDMSSLKKLIVEVILCSFLFYWGFKTDVLSSPFGGSINAGWLALMITPLWIAGVINAVNFSDGLDGLAAGLVFICAASIFAVAFNNGQAASCIMMAYLMGTTLAFLWYNFNPASIFMGDAGALFLGFVLGASTLVEEQKGVTVIALAVPMVVMAVPILDTGLSFLRRLQRAHRGEFFEPDRDHLHHRLLALGLSQKQVVVSLYMVSILAGLMAFMMSVIAEEYRFLIIILAATMIGCGVVVLRFIEGLAKRLPKEELKS
ncbi:MAG: undecaprenyl/decaprenyl-phosphate alpha-N-acetylglucosaminyl 1-phosphate transferase [Candidatus Hydrogenedens sp.]|nr:undecaprenyl/decaprenyl-phosphate alpha-N-acetylglucosaminyl 1-phosphate transferase [Candidatus Hydrogenedens sp.]